MDSDLHEQVAIWDFYKPRQTHSWNMLVLSYRNVDGFEDNSTNHFELEYHWENFILRLWLFRASIRTLEKISFIQKEAKEIIVAFDKEFKHGNRFYLKAIRDMIEHWDDYAANKGRGPAIRSEHLDPWREITHDRYERGDLFLNLDQSYEAAIKLLEGAKRVSKVFTDHYKANILS